MHKWRPVPQHRIIDCFVALSATAPVKAHDIGKTHPITVAHAGHCGTSNMPADTFSASTDGLLVLRNTDGSHPAESSSTGRSDQPFILFRYCRLAGFSPDPYHGQHSDAALIESATSIYPRLALNSRPPVCQRIILINSLAPFLIKKCSSDPESPRESTLEDYSVGSSTSVHGVWNSGFLVWARTTANGIAHPSSRNPVRCPLAQGPPSRPICPAKPPQMGA